MTKILTSETQVLSLPGRRLGFYQGTFDPFTHGHLAVVETSLATSVDHLVICPHSNNPAKRPSPMEHRLSLMDLMASHSPVGDRVSICDPGFLQEGTWSQRFLDLVQALSQDRRQALVVAGDDGITQSYWRPIRSLPHVVFQRAAGLAAVRSVIDGLLTFLPPPHPALPSSTEARRLISAGQRYHAFEDVHAYILAHRMYGSEERCPRLATRRSSPSSHQMRRTP